MPTFASNDRRFAVLGRANARDRWTPIGLAPERTPDAAERRIASFAANGSRLEYAFISVSADPTEQLRQIRGFIHRTAPIA